NIFRAARLSLSATAALTARQPASARTPRLGFISESDPYSVRTFPHSLFRWAVRTWLRTSRAILLRSSLPTAFLMMATPSPLLTFNSSSTQQQYLDHSLSGDNCKRKVSRRTLEDSAKSAPVHSRSRVTRRQASDVTSPAAIWRALPGCQSAVN